MLRLRKIWLFKKQITCMYFIKSTNVVELLIILLVALLDQVSAFCGILA